MEPAAIVVRPVRPDEDIAALTSLIHAAYAPHAAGGLRYWAARQTEEETQRRIAGGRAFVAERRGESLGTILLRPPQPESKVVLYRDPHTWSFSQFAVPPAHQGQGVGKVLHEHIVRVAVDAGAETLALDTAEPATKLIAMYGRWGYEVCGRCDWRPLTNYESVLMRLSLRPGPAPVPKE